MKCFLHIGAEKTGTTSIQRSLELNQVYLEKSNIFYPNMFHNNNHPKIACYAMDDDTVDVRKKRFNLINKENIIAFRKKFIDDFEIELEQKNNDSTIIIVNEHLCRLLHESEVLRLKHFLCNYFDEIKIIIYLRRQDRLMKSLYSTLIKNGSKRDYVFPKYNNKKINIFTTYNYKRILDLWSNIWSKDDISIRIFEIDKLYNNNVVFDFLDFVGIKDKSSIKYIYENKGLSHKALMTLLLINKTINSKHRGNIGKVFGELFPGDGMLVTKNEAVNFLKYFEHDNNLVAKNYLNCDILFSEIDKYEYPKHINPDDLLLSKEDIINIFAHVWRNNIKKKQDS